MTESNSSLPHRTPLPTFVDLDVSGFDLEFGDGNSVPGKTSGVQNRPQGPAARLREERRERLVVQVSLIVALSGLGLAGTRWWLQGVDSLVAWALCFVALAAGLTPLLRRLGVPLNVVAVLAPGSALAAAAVMGLMETGIQSEVAPWLPLMPLVAVLFLGRPGAIGFGAAASLVVGLMVLRSVGLGQFEGEAFAESALRTFAIGGAVGFAAVLGWVYEHGRERTMQELEASEGRTDALVRALPDMLVVLDGEGRVLDTSVPQDLHLPPALALREGEPFIHRMNAELAAAVQERLAEVRRTGRMRHVELRFDMVDAPHEFEARIVPTGGDVLLVVLRDVSEARASARLRDEFVSVVSHELRTPLTAIRGSIGLLMGLGDNVGDAQRTKMTAIANRNAERLAELIDDLLDVQKIEAGRLRIKPQRVEAVEFLQQAVELNEGYALRHEVELTFDPPTVNAHIFADPERLGQVMANLVSNACKFSPAAAEVRITLDLEGAHATIGVHDLGPGIPNEFHGRLFTKFAQADGGSTRESGGTGLGLYITKELVTRMRGDIWFETEQGEGTSFFVRLPTMRAA